jgi:hypothetical protein
MYITSCTGKYFISLLFFLQATLCGYFNVSSFNYGNNYLYDSSINLRSGTRDAASASKKSPVEELILKRIQQNSYHKTYYENRYYRAQAPAQPTPSAM